ASSSGCPRSGRRPEPRALCLRLEGAVPPLDRSGDGAVDARRDLAGRLLQERRVLLDVRSEVLQHAHQPGRRGVQQEPRGGQEGGQAHAGSVYGMRFLLAVAVVLQGCGGCHDPANAADGDLDAEIEVSTPMTAHERTLWEAAKDGDEMGLARLA